MLLGDDDDDKVIMILGAKDKQSRPKNSLTSGGFPAGSGGRLGQPHSQAPRGVRVPENLVRLRAR